MSTEDMLAAVAAIREELARRRQSGRKVALATIDGETHARQLEDSLKSIQRFEAMHRDFEQRRLGERAD